MSHVPEQATATIYDLTRLSTIPPKSGEAVMTTDR